MCRGGTLAGKESGLIVSADGGVTTVFLTGLAKADANGRVTFTKKEWDGISPLIPEHPNQAEYNACIVPLTNALLAKLDPSKSEQCEKIRSGLRENELQRETLRDAMDATSGEQQKRLKTRIETLTATDELTRKNYPECLK
jgi:hypothetical protein